ncbi:DUF6586 family protein [Marinobacter sp. VGCF2001]|uniref:DUF6586 family protein n=1 Tax=Marinobacter sp. VGCF2001 TaxID=3417189 RepID=UPI003CE6B894
MASQWHSLVCQKLFLAKTLVARTEHAEELPAADREALIQGAVELMLRARQLLLTMIARCHQNKAATPTTVDELETLFSYPIAEIGTLRELIDTTGSWWQHLDQLERALSEPPKPRKTVTDENIIAISAEQGPDRSAEALKSTLAAISATARAIDDQHSEW